jgi:RNA polymerase-binding transcription factor
MQQGDDGGAMDTRYDAIRARLEDERSSVERQLAEHGAVDEQGVSVSMNEGFADSAQATAERSQLLSMIEQLRAHHREVVAALERFDAGSYGKCERCGETIPIERLEAIPTARLCVRCKQETGAR